MKKELKKIDSSLGAVGMIVQPNNLLIIQLETAHESKYEILEPKEKLVLLNPAYSYVMLEPGDEVEVKEFWECQ